MSSDFDGDAKVAEIYLVRLGEKRTWAQDSLARGLVRFKWEKLEFEEVLHGDAQTLIKRISETSAMGKPGEAKRDFRRLEALRSSGPADVWVAFVDDKLWWTRMAPGQIEKDDVSWFRRTSGWRDLSARGEPLDLSSLDRETNEINSTSPASVTRMASDKRRAAMLATLGLTRSVEAARPKKAPLSPKAELTQLERDEVGREWRSLWKSIGKVSPIGTAGHGLQVDVGSGKFSWQASVYWSNSKLGNAISLCIHVDRLYPELERRKVRDWLNWQRDDLNGREAERRGNEVPTAYRIGFKFGNGIEFIRRWAAAMNPSRREPASRWELPPASLPVGEPVVPASRPDEASSGNRAGPSPAGVINDAVNPWDQAIARMVHNARSAERRSGKEEVRVAKLKEIRFTQEELATYVRELLEEQGCRCKVSGLPLHFDGEDVGADHDGELLASLDRINADGHYERGNLQVVCWFINRWKSDDTQQNFTRLLTLVREHAR